MFEHFEKTEIRVGTITHAEPFPQARKPAYKLTIDLGPTIGVKKSSAQITQHYTIKDLIGKQILCLVNISPRQIGPFLSEVLTLGVPDQEGNVILVQPERPAVIGGKLF